MYCIILEPYRENSGNKNVNFVIFLFCFRLLIRSHLVLTALQLVLRQPLKEQFMKRKGSATFRDLFIDDEIGFVCDVIHFEGSTVSLYYCIITDE